MKRGLVPAIPFAVSLALSLSTVGSEVYWQDSGLFLSAVRDLGILYPPGFVLYVVLCKAWTLLFFFLDFTLAAHLFSSACAAGAAAGLALATRDLLRSRGPVFRVLPDVEPGLAEWAGIAAGSMAAAGYTLWFTGIYAKGYAFYYLILALLLWRMIRADEDGTPRAFTILALLIGLAWASHPSSACLAPALVVFVARHRATLGAKGIARGAGVAAAAALGPSLLLLPLLAMREPGTALGDPRSLPEILEYAFGLRFVGRRGAFGFEAERAASYGVYLWEEFLAVGLSLLAVGLSSLARLNRGLLLGVLAWVLPYSAMAILFKVEGQHDCWLVAAWLPLHLMVGLGVLMLVRRLPIHLRALAAAAVAAVGVLLAVAANRSDLNQKHYAFAADYGKVLLDNLDPGSILILNDDDALAICGYLQRVKGERPDVAVVALPFLGLSFVSERDWYDRKLLKERPFLRMPDYPGARARLPGVRPLAAHLSAFLYANGGLGRAVFTQAALPPAMLPPGTALVPAGALWKLVPEGQAVLDLKYWSFPLRPEDVQGRVGRARGIRLVRTDDGLRSEAQPYEDRLIALLAKGRASLGELYVRTGRYEEAVQVLDTVMRLEPEYGSDPDMIAALGRAYHGAGDDERAAELLKRALDLGLGPGPAGWALFSLGEIREKAGRAKEAERLYAEASTSAGGDRALLGRLAEKRKPAPPKDR